MAKRAYSDARPAAATNSKRAYKLVYPDYGEPLKVIRKEEMELPPLKPTDVLVKMIAAPVNPADINTIQGKYPAKPKLPAVPGNEGVGEVMQLGDSVSGFKVGDRVIPLTSGLGTWRTHLVVENPKDLLVVPKELGIVEAATLTVNPCTAFRMLRDFCDLKPGDCVIQNGGNSAVGQNVIQICRVWGIKTVNVVRNRPEIEELKGFLRKLGGTEILTEEEIRTTKLFKEGKLPKPRLALNCVGGQSSVEILKHLETGGSHVTYGGMSLAPVTVPTSALIFKDVRVRGFWMTAWSKKNAEAVERFEMLSELIGMMTNNEMHGPVHKFVDFDNFEEAIRNTLTAGGMVGKKYIIRFE